MGAFHSAMAAMRNPDNSGKRIYGNTIMGRGAQRLKKKKDAGGKLTPQESAFLGKVNSDYDLKMASAKEKLGS